MICAATRLVASSGGSASSRFPIEPTRPLTFKLEEFVNLRRHAVDEIPIGAPEPLEVFERKIDSSRGKVSGHVANDICQLQRHPKGDRIVGACLRCGTRIFQCRSTRPPRRPRRQYW